MDDLIVLSPHGAAARAVGAGAVVTGAGRAAVTGAVANLLGSVPAGLPVAVVGTSAAPGLRPGQLGVADEVCGPGVARRLPAAVLVAEELRHDGLEVVVGPVVTEGAPGLAGDDDSAWAVAALPAATPAAVVRAVAGPGALDVLARVRPALERWARATGDRRVLLASPRSFCAGVERAIEIVERALERFGAPVYVRRQIVHNAHVVGELAARGAVFVDELDEVPEGATVVLAAHGVSPEVRAEAIGRDSLRVVDATCPLVAKVHHEARRFAAHGYEIALIGHADHEEVVGTLGEAPMHVVESVADVDTLPDPGDRPLAYLTQTTLATDETAEIVDALRRRFPDLAGPSADDICYATQNRQDAVRAMAAECDLVLVVGSGNSSNTARLVEVARREGARAELVEDAGQLRLAWLDGAVTVGLTAGASAPEILVQEVVEALGRLGRLDVDERRTTEESVRFALPLQVR